MLAFAIIIPNFNQSHFLPTAIESLKHQTEIYNLAVMDGGSTDGFDKVVNNYSDVITFFRSAMDKGQAAAIKEGEEKLSGDIVAWLNADDYYFPDALNKVAACFKKYPEFDVVYGDAIHVTPEGFFLSYFPPFQAFNKYDLTRTCFICQPACFIRRSAYEKVGGINPNLQYVLDLDLWCRLANSGSKFYYFPELLAAVRYYPETKTMSGDSKRYLELWWIERKYGKRLLPTSWPGSYLFQLKNKDTKTIPEEFAYYSLNQLRKLKTKFSNQNGLHKRNNKTEYGFNRWNNQVEGAGTIHLPWYDKRQWKKMCLRVKPDELTYNVTINDSFRKTVLSINNRLIFDVPKIEAINREIKIECLDNRKWEFMQFNCELI